MRAEVLLADVIEVGPAFFARRESPAAEIVILVRRPSDRRRPRRIRRR